ncbi:MAG: YifB family Mg chelatase-like AAA ATPase [Alphaproteobacteria bacterium]|nr:YifB family Mg chelatase-like AAA ATPase [Alphaproteobacteria bacterium]
MVSHCFSVAFEGIHVVLVEVQTHFNYSSFNDFYIVGLPDKTVRESEQRIRAAFSTLGMQTMLPNITINLAPASLHKAGSHYDLPIALSILCKLNIIPRETIQDRIIMGELSLDGQIVSVPGVFAASMIAKEKNKTFICPYANAEEATLTSNQQVIATDTLNSLIDYLNNRNSLPPFSLSTDHVPTSFQDLSLVKGQSAAKRALEIAAAGNHNLLMKGPPGSGKSMLASCLPGILPPLSSRDSHEVNLIASITGQLKNNQLLKHAPFRSPHHSCSMAAMVGGGKHARAGEITLAHRGILFLDEFPEYSKQVLEALRQPMESGIITISRANAHFTYPAIFQLIAAMNPCPCGYLNDPNRMCHKAPVCGKTYLSKLSGPILDRIDLHIDVPEVPLSSLKHLSLGETSEQVRQRVILARACQQQRYHHDDIQTNSQAAMTTIESHLHLTAEAQLFLDKAIERWKLSMRGYTRVLRVARTIADLEQQEQVEKKHLAEAFSYRPLL